MVNSGPKRQSKRWGRTQKIKKNFREGVFQYLEKTIMW